MPKQSTLAAQRPSLKDKSRKVIVKTTDLLKQNERDKGKGKGKDKAVWGELNELIQGESRRFPVGTSTYACGTGAKDLPGALQVERFAEVCVDDEIRGLC